jgi:hypothetical protein
VSTLDIAHAALRCKSAGPIAVCCSRPGSKVEIQPDWLPAAARINGSNVLMYSSARSARPPLETKMRASDGTVTSSRFERRLPGGQHKAAFKLAFGSYGAAARALHVSRMTIWRWCHDKSYYRDLSLKPSLMSSKIKC